MWYNNVSFQISIKDGKNTSNNIVEYFFMGLLKGVDDGWI